MHQHVSLTERILNFREGDADKKRLVADDVYDILQAAYAPIGGLHGSGFASPEDMVRHIPFWKVARIDGDVVAVLMYKTKQGRKVVTMGSDGSREGRLALAKMMMDDMLQNRAYAEISDPALTFMKRHLGAEAVLARAVPHAMVMKRLPQYTIVTEVPETDPNRQRHPDLASFFYQRDIGGALHTKVMVGNPATF